MQNTESNIIILSRPVRSGKTSLLFEFIKDKNNIGGFLTPDSAEGRMLYNIETAEFLPFETKLFKEQETEEVGKFLFLKTAFAAGREILNNSAGKNCVIIDEVGKLEIEQDKGFEPMVKNLVEQYKELQTSKLLLVIRDNLLQKAIAHYGLENALIISTL